MRKTYRFVGVKGQITIPFEIRMNRNIHAGTLFSVEDRDEDTIILHREKICDKCAEANTVEKEASLLDVINSLNASEQKAVFHYLARKLTESEDE